MENLIKSKGWTVLGQPRCSWCTKVRELLVKSGRGYTYVDLTQTEGAVEFLVSNAITTVPQVYHNGKRIGGYEVTEQYLRGLDASA